MKMNIEAIKVLLSHIGHKIEESLTYIFNSNIPNQYKKDNT